MSMPFVTTEIIDSIRTQSLRHINNKSIYCVDVLKEITEENPNLAEAIKETITYICHRCDIDVNTPHGFDIMVNMANLSVSVYQSIKQQMIVDELNE